ncbi:AraC family transcriptional regulator [Pseudomonas sp. RC10]|uniref:AraC family transcriptional regulator n=1 Tax=Pseudomonas bambusae TaxID=3139142 RepID=UPI003138E3D8
MDIYIPTKAPSTHRGFKAPPAYRPKTRTVNPRASDSSYVVVSARTVHNENACSYYEREGQTVLVIFLSEYGELCLEMCNETRRVPITRGTSFILTGPGNRRRATWSAANTFIEITLDNALFLAIHESLGLPKPCPLSLFYHYGQEADFVSLANRLSEKIASVAGIHASLVRSGYHCPAIARFIIAMMLKTRRPGSFALDKQSPKLRLSEPRFAKVSRYIEQKLSSTLHVGELASIASQSQFHFTRTFKARTGQSPHTYILERRLRRSEYLLAETNTSLAQISHECGFSSQSHFTTAFKQCVGITPGQYRELYF